MGVGFATDGVPGRGIDRGVRPMTAPLACWVLAPHFLVHVAQEGAIGSPLAVATHGADRAVILDCCPRAATAGGRGGMPVLVARGCCPALQVAVADPPALHQTATRVEQVLRCYADQVCPATAGSWTLALPALGTHYQQARPVAEHLREHVLRDARVPCVLGLG